MDVENRLKNLILHIALKEDYEITAEQACDMVEVAFSRFFELFRQHTGESFGHYKRRIVLERAALWLKYTNAATYEIALSAGYDSRCSFSRAFSSLFGTSPKVFRDREHAKLNSLRSKFGSKLPETTIEDMPSYNFVATMFTGSYSKLVHQWMQVASLDMIRDNKFLPWKLIGINLDEPSITPANKLRYIAGVLCDDLDCIGFEEKNLLFASLTAQKCVCMDYFGYPLGEQSAWDRFIATFEKNNFFPKCGVCFSLYDNTDVPRRLSDLPQFLMRKHRSRLCIPIQFVPSLTMPAIGKCFKS